MMKWLIYPAAAAAVVIVGSMPAARTFGRTAFDYTMTALMVRYVDATTLTTGCLF